MIEAMKQALDALEEFGHHYETCARRPYLNVRHDLQPECDCGYDKAVIDLEYAISEAESRSIEQAEKQEPVYQMAMVNGPANTAWIDVDEATYHSARLLPNEYKVRTLYTTPTAAQRELVELTDEDIEDCAMLQDATDPTDALWKDFARAIEDKLIGKST